MQSRQIVVKNSKRSYDQWLLSDKRSVRLSDYVAVMIENYKVSFQFSTRMINYRHFIHRLDHNNMILIPLGQTFVFYPNPNLSYAFPPIFQRRNFSN